MNIKRKVLFLAIILLFYPLPAFGTEKSHSTTIVISFDGMRHDFLQSYMKKGFMPNFKNVADHGKIAKNFRTIFPSLTSSSHAAIATGAYPDSTGMVSNNIHKPNKKLTDNESAFFSKLDVEPVWSVIREEGKKTATIIFPGSNPEYGNQADYAIYYNETLAESAFDSLHFEEVHHKNKGEMQVVFPLKMKKNEELLLHISKDSAEVFQLSLNHPLSSKEKVKVNEWGFLSFPTKNAEMAGFAFKIKSTKKDLSDAKLYHTAITQGVVTGPANFKEDIYKNFNYFPVQEDDKALEEKWITRKEYEEISEHFAQWTTDVSIFIKNRYKPDMLFFYYPQVDHESHKYLLVDPRQPGYSKKKSERYMNYIFWSYKLADKMLGQVLSHTNQEDRLFLVSDHGMEPIHSKLSPNEELERRELLVKKDNGEISLKESKAYAVSSGSIAHIYINLKGREANGIVEREKYKDVQNEIATIFKEINMYDKTIPLSTFMSFSVNNLLSYMRNDTEESPTNLKKAGKQTFFTQEVNPYDQIIINRQNYPKNKGQLLHKNAGDVILVAKKGYYMTQDDGNEVMLPDDLGSHGGNPSRKELRPIFLAMVPGIKKGIMTSEISTLDIAPTLYDLMGIQPPSFVKGKVITELTESENEEK